MPAPAFLLMLFTTLFLSACSNAEDARLLMCQSIARQLTNNTITDFSAPERQQAAQTEQISISYAAPGINGHISCSHVEEGEDDPAVIPQAVSLNNTAIDRAVLLHAAAYASRNLLGSLERSPEKRDQKMAAEISQAAKALPRLPDAPATAATDTGNAASEETPQAETGRDE